MNNQNQTKRQNSIAFTGNVAQVKPLNGGACAISLAYNEGSQVNGQWETTDTLFMECYLPAKLNFIPNIGDRMTISGFLASNNYTPQGGNKRYGVKIVVNQIDEYSPKQANQTPAQQQYQGQPQQYHPQGGQQPQQRPQQQYQPQGGQQPQQRPQQQYQPQGAYQPQQRPQQQYQARPQHYQPQQNFQENGGFAG